MDVKTGRRAIYIPNSDISGLYRLLALRGEEQNFSNLIDAAVDRYLITINNSLPDFTDAEWCTIFDALQATYVSGEAYLLAIGEEVIEAIEYDGLDTKWEVDGDGLKARLSHLTYAEQQAIGEMVEAFRLTMKKGGLGSYSAAIADIKRLFRPETSGESRPERRSMRMSPDAL
jgi:hypothetical protein